ncbi:hypothetical protein ACFLZB_00485 [Nanoarchaeota archaeon]
MPEDTIKVKTEITQVKDGREYKGKITVDGAIVFDYNIKFNKHIENLGEGMDEILSAIHLKVNQGDRSVPLIEGEEAHKFFHYLILNGTIDFYSHPQTRGGQNLVAMNPQLAAFGASTSIGMSFEGSIKRSLELEEIMAEYRAETPEEPKVPAEPKEETPYEKPEGMNHLFICRHGEYGRVDLTPNGIKEIENLGRKIKDILGDSTAYILSSTAPRAQQSAGILAVQLGLPEEFETSQELWTGSDSTKERKKYCDSELLIRMVDERRDRADGLVLATHFEVCRDLPGDFYQREFGKQKHFGRLDTAEAHYLNLQTQEHKVIG